MVLQLHGSPVSTCTKRVAAVLVEKQVPFVFYSIDIFKGEQKTPEHLARQPFGVVPFIVEDDGFVLYESRAICRYIAIKYANQGTALVPAPDDLKKVALLEQAASIETGYFDPYVSVFVREKVFVPLFAPGVPVNEEAAGKALTTLDSKLSVYDQILAKQAYLAGDEITFADIFHLPWGSHLKDGGSDIMESKPNVARWWKSLTSRPSWLAVVDGVSSHEKY